MISMSSVKSSRTNLDQTLFSMFFCWFWEVHNKSPWSGGRFPLINIWHQISAKVPASFRAQHAEFAPCCSASFRVKNPKHLILFTPKNRSEAVTGHSKTWRCGRKAIWLFFFPLKPKRFPLDLAGIQGSDSSAQLENATGQTCPSGSGAPAESFREEKCPFKTPANLSLPPAPLGLITCLKQN